MKSFTIGSLIVISILALIAHADRLPQPPGPAYDGFMPGNWQYRETPDPAAGCG